MILPAKTWIDEMAFLAKMTKIGDNTITKSNKATPHICETLALPISSSAKRLTRLTNEFKIEFSVAWNAREPSKYFLPCLSLISVTSLAKIWVVLKNKKVQKKWYIIALRECKLDGSEN